MNLQLSAINTCELTVAKLLEMDFKFDFRITGRHGLKSKSANKKRVFKGSGLKFSPNMKVTGNTKAQKVDKHDK